jgi:iron complex outermembrane receptor protein
VSFEEMQVTATRTPEAASHIPASVTVVRGDELRARGADDLHTALSLVAGVEISPGGDEGPAGAVPALWGLREFDAFLLVVDGVPWGGAFNPALTTLDLHNIERIEVMRGAAPVMFGATSFVGVIHVIHYPADRSEQRAFASVGGVSGNFGTATLGASMALSTGAVDQSLSANVENNEFTDENSGFRRGHVMYRAGTDIAGGRARFDIDLTVLHQGPASPVVREGPVLTTKTPLDANHNPRDAGLDENRIQLVGGFEREVALGAWGTTVALSHADHDIVRGFLRDVETDPANADGFDQDREIYDVYLDSHLTSQLSSALELTYGFDWIFGHAEQASRNFDYQIALDGTGAPHSGSLPTTARTPLEDERNFFGLYAQGDWNIVPTVDLILGIRQSDE